MKVNEIRMQAFAEELEKIAGPYSFVGKMLNKVIPGISGKISKTLSSAAARSKGSIPRQMAGVSSGARYNQAMKLFGKKGNPSQMNTFFGLGGRAKDLRVRAIRAPKKNVPLSQKPLNWAKGKIDDLGGNLNYIKNKGVMSFLKKEIGQARRFTKTVTDPKTGKAFEVSGKRSIAGQLVNPIMGTGVGMGALTYAGNATDAQGKKIGKTKRIGEAAFDAAMWGGPLAPVTAPIMGAKLVSDMFSSKNR